MAKPVSDYDRAAKLLEIYGGEADDFFKLWPPDKRYFFSSDHKAFLAYSVRHNVAICMGDPVGPKQSVKLLLNEFKPYCSEYGWTMAFIQTAGRFRSEYSSAGLKSVVIGADAVINLSDFTSKTIHNKYFRNLANRFEKQHFRVSKHEPPHNKKLINQLREVSDSWKKMPHRKEWSFLTGRFDDAYLQQVSLYVLRDNKTRAQAFANELPSFKPGVATIDLMRHRSDAPTNSVDMLFIRLLHDKERVGYSYFNLGMSPLDGEQFITSPFAKLLVYLYKASDKYIGFKGLHQFKAKYEPRWEVRYVWYQGSSAHLPRIGLAVYKLMKGS